MLSRVSVPERAIVVFLDFSNPEYSEALDEICNLVSSAGASVSAKVGGKRYKPDTATFAGSGKLEEVANLVQLFKADLVVFNHAISPSQQRNIERVVKCRVIDRSSLILDIFAQRAMSHEGKVQVELAQLSHLATRLVRGWTHLERQKGGIGLRGPGETQLETDRRLLGNRVKALKQRLKVIEKQRNTRRASRQRHDVFNVSLVGYTNAGKSTLFNRLTKSQVQAEDKLFATLDPTTRKLGFFEGIRLTLTDTVGFVSDLPHTLIDAFKSTLVETAEADLLFHVVDWSSSNRENQINEVNKVLAEIGAHRVPQIIVYNKIDRTPEAPGIVKSPCGNISSVKLSSLTGEGVDLFRREFPGFVQPLVGEKLSIFEAEL